MQDKKKRNINLDLIRNIALFMLISVHFLLNNDFYRTEIIGNKMYIATIFRGLFMICVPLFLLLSGYLLNKRELNKKHYKGLIKIVFNYILAIIFVYVFTSLYKHENLSLTKLSSTILSFKDSAWYINMYIGLFLLVPFLNIIYWNLKTKKQKQVLVLTMLILTTLPSILNIYNFKEGNWLFSSQQSDGYNSIIPNWWVGVYPITYYFIGAYLSEYKIKMSKIKNVLLIIGVLLLNGTFNYMRSYGKSFEWAIYTDWGSIQNILSSTLIFLLIINMDFKRMPKWISKVISKNSELSYVAYLVSQFFELVIYTYINNNCSGFYNKVQFYLPATLGIFVSSIIVSYLINCIYKLIIKFAKYSYFKILKITKKKGEEK